MADRLIGGPSAKLVLTVDLIRATTLLRQSFGELVRLVTHF
jgi:hypothetical protein